VAHGDKIVMEPNLNAALQSIFGKDVGRTSEKPLTPSPATEIGTGTKTQKSLKELASEAGSVYEEGLNKLKAGDWAGYGESNKRLKSLIDELSQKAGQ